MPLSPGDRLDEFVLIRRIGEGAFGEVWEAENSAADGARVALKVPTHPDAASELRKEGRIQERLTHPRIVPSLALRLDHDPPYVVFELVEGPSLADVLRENGVLAWAVAVRILRGLLDALAYAHQHGVIHRDIKPANVLLSPDGDVLLTDFGLGRASEAAARSLSLSVSRSSEDELRLVGTLRYMSPEQAAGREATAESDLYATGVILHEMLTGDATRLRFPIPDAPIWLSNIVEKVTRPDPAQRYASAEQMTASLDATVQRARVRGVFSRLRMDAAEKSTARRVLWLFAAAVVGAIVFALTLGGDVWESRVTPSPQPPVASEERPDATLTASRRELYALAASPDGRVVAAGGLDGVVTLWEVPSRIRILSTDMPCATHALAFSRNGQRLVAGGSDGKIRILEVSTGRALEEFSGHESAVGSLAVSEDDALVVSGSWDWTVRVWDAERGTLRAVLLGAPEPVGQRPAAWSFPEQGCEVAVRGNRLVANDRMGALHEWELTGLQELDEATRVAEPVRALARSADGDYGCVTRGGSILWFGELPGSVFRALGRGTSRACGIAFGSERRFLAACGWGGGAWLWDLGRSERVLRLPLPRGEANDVLFVAGELWSANADGTLTIWKLPAGE